MKAETIIDAMANRYESHLRSVRARSGSSNEREVANRQMHEHQAYAIYNVAVLAGILAPFLDRYEELKGHERRSESRASKEPWGGL